MSFDSEMKAALETFVLESRELLQDMEELLLGLEQDGAAPEAINAIFRAAHTIKGSSGLFGLEHIVHFTHLLESVLDLVRDAAVPVTPALIAVLLPCRDHLAELIEGLADGATGESAESALAGAALHEQLRTFMAPRAELCATPTETTTSSSGGSQLDGGNWYLSLRFGADCLRNGMDPLSFIRYLSTLGEVVQLLTIAERLPDIESMDAETCYLGFEVILKSEATKETIENVFEFVREDSVIRILPPRSKIDEYIAIINALPDELELIGEILISSGVLTKNELAAGLQMQAQQSGPIGEILVEQDMLQGPVLQAALNKQQQVKEAKTRERQNIRVDAERLDKLIDLVGELVIAGAGSHLRASKTRDAGLLESTMEVMRLVEEVRDSALQLRMVPIGTTFSRFQRVVRDVSLELGKDIVLEISGGDTEVDKSVVEKIGDPLMHLVRNSMDHGIESAALRQARGKPVQGTLSLNAYHESGTIIIEVSDDGGGLDRDKILAKAVERGLVAAHAQLSDKEIYALIFEPGFSTADQVSNLSGRGVGMDVVKRNVTALRGSIDIDSQSGIGSTMCIRLPLTLAIIDGFLVGVADSSFVVPLDNVIECLEMPKQSEALDYMDLRGEVLPFIRLRSLFEIEGALPRRQNVVVVGYGGNKTGLVVDRLMGEFQTVIKPLGKLFNHVRGIGGSTILGSGEVALILSVPALTQYYAKQEQQQHPLSPAPTLAYTK
ncbi:MULTISPECIES: chemotaxis protein CheA [unclassified Undibacterium]|uniref:chemotaxis protein CheA n=1 Tax=unclassified Undibacterium TaxID=2630295 RepID=UPI002AC96685|nr:MULTISPECIES: chemotaxis protein CheA [unclassified Undibacterium]MEB0140739.1 chemotaxis protein CheA [Undibacterium sp. CCC2.1]MEB0174098.1 chemotaxis protein CheA [Undibacterium sp. CCC1.1]MEB0178075.1 chemotaxis protein CheA [Undibacterium sp. CCC3.4]MEB0216945.1 chemotaxis protein CheA [Undibacterium sp. 5I2]WPX44536.1 chemotaxis protein CheA [Undibacterium sp. CCC3.4]